MTNFSYLLLISIQRTPNLTQIHKLIFYSIIQSLQAKYVFINTGYASVGYINIVMQSQCIMFILILQINYTRA